MKKYYIFFLLLSSFITNLVYGETIASVNSQNEAIVSDDGLGVEVKLDKDGKLLSLKSTYYHAVEFPDRRGVNKAYLIAEEKAKGNIARFMNQSITSSRITTEIDESIGKSQRLKSTNSESWSKENTRNVTESLKEITTSNSAAILQGVRVLERVYDEKKEEVKIVVGINKDSRDAANQASNFMSNSEQSKTSSQSEPSKSSNRQFPAIPTEQKRVRDANQF